MVTLPIEKLWWLFRRIKKNYVIIYHRCTVVFKFFLGGTWDCEIIWGGGGPLFLCFITFLKPNFSKSFEGVHQVANKHLPTLT
jgi:hypothetical protein